MGIGQRITLGALLELATLCGAQAASCPQFFAGNTPPALLSETQKIATVPPCNDDYVLLESEQTKRLIGSA